MPLDIAAMPLWAVGGVFAAAALVVWAAGTRLSGYVGLFADRTGLSGAAAGLLILGVITSLPDIAASTAAAWSGDAQLAAGDLLGAVALQVVMVAVADAVVGRRALTASLPSPAVLLQANMGVILLMLTAAGVIVGDLSVGGVMGLWPPLIAALYVATPFLARAAEARKDPQARAALAEIEALTRAHRPGGERGEDQDLRILAAKILAVAAVICVGGFLLASAGGELATRTGMGSNFFGAVFLAGATALPELSAAVAAARLNRADMAVGDILGSNMVNLAMLFVADLVYPGDAIFNELGRFSAVSAMLAAVLTAIFMIGLIERRDRSILRMGYDSVAVLVVYAAGLALLFQLR